MAAVHQFRAMGIQVDHLGMPTVYSLDKALVRKSALKTHRVVTGKEHYRNGGLGTIVTEYLSDCSDVTVKRMDMPIALPPPAVMRKSFRTMGLMSVG